ncbi:MULTISPECIES: replication-relaxation family protein [Streptomyces]|uniref:replication-relaxation family protein n=1 Tax=Streptomyces TaxID=1883 RepID=UPI0022AEA747|nr:MULTISPECIES: replication-relaxation family protein [Streptomyces]MCZ4102089.1 replication-relaxation family protein [Streptomyces sp. H39-C1]
MLAQWRSTGLVTTEQMHRVIAPSARIGQTRRRLARLGVEGLVDRITLPQAGRTPVWFSTAYGVQVVAPPQRGEGVPSRCFIPDRSLQALACRLLQPSTDRPLATPGGQRLECVVEALAVLGQ